MNTFTIKLSAQELRMIITALAPKATDPLTLNLICKLWSILNG